MGRPLPEGAKVAYAPRCGISFTIGAWVSSQERWNSSRLIPAFGVTMYMSFTIEHPLAQPNYISAETSPHTT